MPKKPTKSKKAWLPSSTSALNPLMAELAQLETQLRSRQFKKAYPVLKRLAETHPKVTEIHAMLSICALELGEPLVALKATEHILAEGRADVDSFSVYAELCESNGLSMTMCWCYRQITERWPNSAEAGSAKLKLMLLENVLANIDLPANLKVPKDLEALSLLERGGFWMAEQDEAYAARLLAEGVRRWPEQKEFARLLADASFQLGQVAEALAIARRLAVAAPDSPHVQGFLVQMLIGAGQLQEATETAKRLRTLTPQDAGEAASLLRALAYVGDYAAVLASYSQYHALFAGGDGIYVGSCYHTAAVAESRLGNAKRAQELWSAALKADPEDETILENIRNAKLPTEQQHPAWVSTLLAWIPKTTRKEFAEAVRLDESPNGSGANTRRVLAEHPEFGRLIGYLLEHGDPLARETVIDIAQAAELPELGPALREFAFGQRCPDALRFRAAAVALQLGAIEPGEHPLFVKGEPKPVLLVSFNLRDEPTDFGGPPEAQKLVDQSVGLLREQRALEAQSLLREAMRLAPDRPDVPYNLHVALSMLGCDGEARELLTSVHARFPTYVFARTALAEAALREERFDDAKALLQPVLQTKRLHEAEFAALATVEINLALKQNLLDTAKSWLRMMEQILPKSPDLPGLRKLLQAHDVPTLAASAAPRLMRRRQLRQIT